MDIKKMNFINLINSWKPQSLGWRNLRDKPDTKKMPEVRVHSPDHVEVKNPSGKGGRKNKGNSLQGTKPKKKAFSKSPTVFTKLDHIAQGDDQYGFKKCEPLFEQVPRIIEFNQEMLGSPPESVCQFDH
jgi:hypothetical protein